MTRRTRSAVRVRPERTLLPLGALLLLGACAGDTAGSPSPPLDQSPPLNDRVPALSTTAPPLNTTSPPLNSDIPPCQGTTSSEELMQLVTNAFCRQADACAGAESQAAFAELCTGFGACVQDPTSSDCLAEGIPAALPVCPAEVSACLTAFFAEIGCAGDFDQVDMEAVPECSRVFASESTSSEESVDTGTQLDAG